MTMKTKRIQIILGENEASIAMEINEEIAVQIFKKVSDEIFAERYGLVREEKSQPTNLLSRLKEDVGTDSDDLDNELPVIMKGVHNQLKASADYFNEPVVGIPTTEAPSSMLDELVGESLRIIDEGDYLEHLPADFNRLLIYACEKCSSVFMINTRYGDTSKKCSCGECVDTSAEFIKGTYDCKCCNHSGYFLASTSIKSRYIKCKNCSKNITLTLDKSGKSLSNKRHL